MQITDVRIRRLDANGNLKAIVAVTFDECFVVHGIKIVNGKSGLIVAMPSKKSASGEYMDVAHPISPEFRTELQNAILKEYNSGKEEEL